MQLVFSVLQTPWRWNPKCHHSCDFCALVCWCLVLWRPHHFHLDAHTNALQNGSVPQHWHYCKRNKYYLPIALIPASAHESTRWEITAKIYLISVHTFPLMHILLSLHLFFGPIMAINMYSVPVVFLSPIILVFDSHSLSLQHPKSS